MRMLRDYAVVKKAECVLRNCGTQLVQGGTPMAAVSPMHRHVNSPPGSPSLAKHATPLPFSGVQVGIGQAVVCNNVFKNLSEIQPCFLLISILDGHQELICRFTNQSRRRASNQICHGELGSAQALPPGSTQSSCGWVGMPRESWWIAGIPLLLFGTGSGDPFSCCLLEVCCLFPFNFERSKASFRAAYAANKLCESSCKHGHEVAPHCNN
jgi:hypothetical protein